MQRHDWSSTSPKEPMLHLSLSPCTGYQLQLASSSRHWCFHIEQPQAQHPPTSTHYYESTSPPEVWDLLVSDASWYHHREAQNHSPEHSLSPFLAGWMIFPPTSGMLDPCQISSNNWKLISFNSTWLLKKKKKKSLFSKSLSFPPSLASLYFFEQCLRLGVIGTSSVCLPLQDESLYVLPNCKSLWIKASAKWLNVNKSTQTSRLNQSSKNTWVIQLNRVFLSLSVISHLTTISYCTLSLIQDFHSHLGTVDRIVTYLIGSSLHRHKNV